MPSLQERIRMPFPAKMIRWRIARSGVKNNRPWAQVLAYLDARDYRTRLDEVFGQRGTNWYPEYAWQGKVLICTIHFKVDDLWYNYSDGADETAVEPGKGMISESFKRTCLSMGFGEYLYKLGDSWAIFTDTGDYSSKIDGSYMKWNPPQLPSWAVPQ